RMKHPQPQRDRQSGMDASEEEERPEAVMQDRRHRRGTPATVSGARPLAQGGTRYRPVAKGFRRRRHRFSPSATPDWRKAMRVADHRRATTVSPGSSTSRNP